MLPLIHATSIHTIQCITTKPLLPVPCHGGHPQSNPVMAKSKVLLPFLSLCTFQCMPPTHCLSQNHDPWDQQWSLSPIMISPSIWTYQMLYEMAAFINSFWFLESLIITAMRWNSEEVLTTTGEKDLVKISFSMHFQDRSKQDSSDGSCSTNLFFFSLWPLSTFPTSKQASPTIWLYFEHHSAFLCHLTLISDMSSADERLLTICGKSHSVKPN